MFGPFPNVNAARRTVEIINRVYPLRKCANLGKDVCLYYHLGECLGYCQNTIDEDNDRINWNRVLVKDVYENDIQCDSTEWKSHDWQLFRRDKKL